MQFMIYKILLCTYLIIYNVISQVVLTCAIAASCGQLVDERDAKIVKEQRFNAGDGRAGSAFATENEIVYREETALDGSRIGQYSYIGDDGQTYTVKYSAGKEGFRILEGAHIPSGGQDAAAFVATPAPEPAQPRQQPIAHWKMPIISRLVCSRVVGYFYLLFN